MKFFIFLPFLICHISFCRYQRKKQLLVNKFFSKMNILLSWQWQNILKHTNTEKTVFFISFIHHLSKVNLYFSWVILFNQIQKKTMFYAVLWYFVLVFDESMLKNGLKWQKMLKLDLKTVIEHYNIGFF